MNMHAIRIHKFGGPEVLKDEVLPVPTPEGDEILVRVAAASVNPVDHKTCEGKFPKVSGDALPITLGRDLSGEIEALGPNASGVSKGQPVFALLGYDRGAYVQHVVLKPGEWAPKPANISHIEAAAGPNISRHGCLVMQASV